MSVRSTTAGALHSGQCVRGEDTYNRILSQRRAESVRAWLMHHGVAESRMTATGAGEFFIRSIVLGGKDGQEAA